MLSLTIGNNLRISNASMTAVIAISYRSAPQQAPTPPTSHSANFEKTKNDLGRYH